MQWKGIVAALLLLLSPQLWAETWQQTEQNARGQSVYFHAWGGSPEINAYLRWVKKELQVKYGIDFIHVKVSDIAETTQLLLSEKKAGKNHGGSVDMVWINGENFKAMKQQQLLFGPFVERLPNWQLVDQSLPVTLDFTEPTDGYEAPWGVGQLVFIYDHQQLNNPPKNFAELLSYASAFPGTISYPQPPDFHGTSFLKAALLELTDNPEALYLPVDPKTFEQVTAPLWQYLDLLHKVAWRQGKQFLSGSSQSMQLLNDGEIDLAIAFNPNAAFAGAVSGTLPPTAKAHAFEQGALTNIHFLAIPWNSDHSAAAQVTINFLLSPVAQRRKMDMSIWGDPTVLRADAIDPDNQGYAMALFPAINEPHPSWQSALEQAWLKRYGQ
ncbi:Protein YnjB [Vibrio stylophorae]|uniref:Protein YnjB n=1 Tax=Vibrio stylophorae TaxID=659351 RepID=A0ABN8DS70_9VIBR|nr:ABC transporter substrate-binding protein [Vibrio stylophorae]CAH0533044.1 Protein YnjB [Vibrio stylophorae]